MLGKWILKKNTHTHYASTKTFSQQMQQLEKEDFFKLVQSPDPPTGNCHEKTGL